MNNEKKLISICVPVYNEEENIDRFYHAICEIALREEKYQFEFLFTDNHSEDKTFEKLASLAKYDSRIRILRFSRNFGFQKSIMTNYLNSRGAAAIQIDCDLQDRPSLISDFLRYWEKDYKVVYGIRRARKENWILHGLRRLYYRFLDFISEDHIPHDAGDFRLVDRCIIEELRSINDNQPYLRGLIAAMGFKQIGIPFDRDARLAGKSKFNLPRLISLGLDGVLQHSIMPLRIATFIGIVIFLIALLGTVYYLIARFTIHDTWPEGLASSSILLLMTMGMNAIFLGIIGEYIGRIYRNTKKSSFTIVEATIDSNDLTSKDKAA